MKKFDFKAAAKWERDLRKRLGKITPGELGDLDMTLTYFILPRLERFKKIETGHPGSMTNKEWQAILRKIIQAFKWKLDDNEWKLPQKRQEDRRAKIKEGLRLFGEHFESLWL